ncbi:MAG: YncE family protein, partial [Thermoplasmata archaeon]
TRRFGWGAGIALLGVAVAFLLTVPGIAPGALSPTPPAASGGSLRPTGGPPSAASSGGPNGSFSVSATTVLANNTTVPGNFLASNGIVPDATAYDPNGSTLWVANGGSGTVSVINLTLGRMVAAVPVGSGPVALLYDPGLDRVFVVNQYSGNLSIINATSFRSIGSVTVGLAPLAVALDPARQTVYVAVSRFSLSAILNGQPLDNGSLLAVDAATLQVVGNFSLFQTIPTDVIYGPSGDLYTVSLGGCRVTTLDPASGSILGNASLPAGTCGWAYHRQACPYVVNSLPGSATLADDPTGGMLYVGVTNTLTFCNYTNSLEALDLANSSWVYGRTVPFGADGLGNSSLTQVAFDPEIPALLAQYSGNGTTGTLAALAPAGFATLGVRSIPGVVQGVEYAPALPAVVYANGGTGRVVLANVTTLDPMARFAVGADPVALAAASNLGGVAVAEYSQNSVALMNATQGTIVGEWPVGVEPAALAYDPQTDVLAVANSGSGNLTILNLSGAPAGSIPIGGTPSAVAFDPTQATWWVAGGTSGTVTEVSARTGSVARIVPIAPDAILSGLVFDPGTDSVYVGLLTNSTVAVINATTGGVEALIPVGYAPSSLVYISTIGAVVVANAGSGSLSFVNDTTLNVTASIPLTNLPLALAYDSAQGVILAAQFGGDSLAFVTVATLTVRNFLAVGREPSGVAYDPATGTAFVANAGSGTISTVAAAGYPVRAVESGLPANATWWFNVTGGARVSSTQANLTLHLINGTYAFSASTSTPGFASSPGFFIVDGQPTTVRVAFSPATSPVTFDAVGLPSGTPWYVNLSGGYGGSSRGSSITFNLTNRSYTFTVQTPDRSYAPEPAAGEFVVEGSLLGIEVRFTPVTSPVVFQETGLPNGTVWWVRTAGEQFTDNQSVMAVGLANGTYTYTVGTANSSFRATGGNFTVAGAEINVPIDFQLVAYPVVIAQSGLSNSTAWSIVIDGRSVIARNGTAEIDLPNGSYAFRVVAPSGYAAAPASGVVTVRGSPVTQVVAFSPNGSTSSTRLYLVAGIAVGAFVAGTIIFLIGRRRYPPTR